MAGTLLISSIQLDSDNNFSIISNTGTTLLSANGTGLITGVANNSLANKTITNPTITTPTITGNTTIDSGTLFVDATNDRVGMGTTNPSQKLHITGAMLVGNGGVDEYVYFDSTAAYVGRNASTGDIWLNNGGSQNTIFGVGGTEAMKINGNGYVTKPLQPGFKAGRDTIQSLGAYGTVVFDTTGATGGYNTGSHYNTSTGRFTAPVAGVYQFSVGLLARAVSDGTMFECALHINGNPCGYYERKPYKANYTGEGGYFCISGSSPSLYLNVGDYVDFRDTWGNGFSVHANANFCYFTGYLLG